MITNLNTKGKVAIVTGSSRGIGFAIAKCFAGAEMKVFINSPRKESIGRALLQLSKDGLSAEAIVGDATDEKFARTSVQNILKENDHIDVLVNNLGIYEHRTFEEISVPQFQHFLNLNLISTFLWTQAVLPIMKKHRYGKIINVASIAGIQGRKFGAHYNAAKGGVVAMSLGLAKELGSFGVRVNVLVPGLVETETVKELQKNSKKFIEENLRGTPLGHLATPEAVADSALFLASPLSDEMTGQILYVDGGYHLQ